MKKLLAQLSFLALTIIIITGVISCAGRSSEKEAAEVINYGSNNGRYVTVNNTKIYYEEYGQGTPLLVFHGGLSSIKGLSSVIPEFSKHFRVIAIDAPGNGRSEQADSVSFQLMAGFYAKIIDSLKLDSVYLFGFSLGGITALHLAADSPDKVKMLIAHAAVNHLDGYNEGFAGTPEMTPEVVEKDAQWWVKGHLERTPQPDKWKKFIKDLQGVWNPKEFISDEKLKSIKCPALIIQGDQDLIKIENAIHMHQLIPGSQLCILPGTTHFAYSENPDLLLRVVTPFLIKTSKNVSELAY